MSCAVRSCCMQYRGGQEIDLNLPHILLPFNTTNDSQHPIFHPYQQRPPPDTCSPSTAQLCLDLSASGVPDGAPRRAQRATHSQIHCRYPQAPANHTSAAAREPSHAHNLRYISDIEKTQPRHLSRLPAMNTVIHPGHDHSPTGLTIHSERPEGGGGGRRIRSDLQLPTTHQSSTPGD